MISRTYGYLAVVQENLEASRRSWVCKCICGNARIVREDRLKAGEVFSCGCIKRPTGRRKAALTGRRFGRLTVLKKVGKIRTASAWLCRCDCGNEKILTSSSLCSVRSCGCLARSDKGPGLIPRGVKVKRWKTRSGEKIAYVAAVKVKGRSIHLGTFRCVVEASKKYQEAITANPIGVSR